MMSKWINWKHEFFSIEKKSMRSFVYNHNLFHFYDFIGVKN